MLRVPGKTRLVGRVYGHPPRPPRLDKSRTFTLRFVYRLAWLGLVCLVTAALLSACDDDPMPATTAGLSNATTPPPTTTSTPVLPTPEPTATPTSEPTATPTPEPTATPTPEPTATPTPEPTATPTPEPTATPTPEATATPTPQSTATPAATPITTPTYTPTPRPTQTATPAPTSSPTPTATVAGLVVELLPWGGYVNRCVNDIRRRPSQPLIQWRFHPHTVHRDRRLRSTQGPSDA